MGPIIVLIQTSECGTHIVSVAGKPSFMSMNLGALCLSVRNSDGAFVASSMAADGLTQLHTF